MQTQIIPCSEIMRAALSLKRGNPVAFPTETVYGLGAPIWNSDAIAQVFHIKGRPADNPLIAHVDSIEQVSAICEKITPAFFLLAKRFWPGPLAIVLNKRACVPDIATGGLATLAVRMPDHLAALDLIRQTGCPLVAPSANLSGRPSPTKASDAYEDLKGKVELILDGGECRIGIESTVIYLTSEQHVLLRPGAVSQEELEEVLGNKLILPQTEDRPISPGMKYRHYAPFASVRFLADGESTKEGQLVLSPNPRPGEMLLSAKTLYAAFREADRRGISEILIDCDNSVRKNRALLNRLEKVVGAKADCMPCI